MVQTVAPPPMLTVSQWADAHRKLSSESSAEPGRWRTDRAPYQREILDAVNDPSVERIIVMSSAQVGKTELLLNAIGYYIDYDPSPILALQPTLEMAQTFSKDRLAPMVRDTSTITNKVADSKSKSSGNTMLHKTFPGGHITMAGANSPASLASRPIRIVLADEIDRYPLSAGAEGDPVNLAIKRTTTFWNRKIILVSTPTVKGASRIETAYEDSTQEIYSLPCPSCGTYQQIKRKHIQHEKEGDELVNVTAACEKCGVIHSEHDWKKQAGEWVAQKEHHKNRGFHMNEYMSPWRTWLDIELDFLEAKKSPETLKTFVNTSLGETWEEEGETVDETGLLARREDYKKIPVGGLVLTAGVDVQDDRLEAEIIAWGEGEENWNIDYKVFHGKPDQAQVWNDLDDLLFSDYEHESGNRLHIAATCIDSGGHYTQEVYDFCRPRQTRRIYAVKGVGGPGRPIVSAPAKRGSGNRVKKVHLFTVGTDDCKGIIYSRLRLTKPGPGYCHFPMERDEEYFLQLTAEKMMTKYVKGFPRKVWEKTRPRNEALDTRQYAYAALKILNPVFSALKKRLEVEPEKEVPEEQEEKPETVTQKRRKARRPGTKKGFVNSWR